MSALTARPLASRTLAAASPKVRFDAGLALMQAVLQEIHLRLEIRRAKALDSTMLRDIGMDRGSIDHAVRHGRGR